MLCNVSVTLLLLLLTMTATCYAVDPRQYDELDRGRVMRPEPRPPMKQPASVRERQEMQRSESQNRGENATGFRSPPTVSLDRLKLRSDTLAEYQFESVPTMTPEGADPAPQEQDLQSPQNEAVSEEPPPAQSEAVSGEPPADQVVEEITGDDAVSDGDDPVTEKVVLSGGNQVFRIIEDASKIIVLQVDSTGGR